MPAGASPRCQCRCSALVLPVRRRQCCRQRRSGCWLARGRRRQRRRRWAGDHAQARPERLQGAPANLTRPSRATSTCRRQGLYAASHSEQRPTGGREACRPAGQHADAGYCRHVECWALQACGSWDGRGGCLLGRRIRREATAGRMGDGVVRLGPFQAPEQIPALSGRAGTAPSRLLCGAGRICSRRAHLARAARCESVADALTPATCSQGRRGTVQSAVSGSRGGHGGRRCTSAPATGCEALRSRTSVLC